MAFTHTIGHTYKTDAGQVSSTSWSYADDTEINVDSAVPASTTNKQVDVAVTVANIKSVCIYSDQALTVKTNSTGSPQETITLKAREAVIYSADTGTAPFAGNVTAMYLTNAGTATANFKFRVLLNQEA